MWWLLPLVVLDGCENGKHIYLPAVLVNLCGEVLFVLFTFDMSFSCYIHLHVPGAKFLLVWSG